MLAASVIFQTPNIFIVGRTGKAVYVFRKRSPVSNGFHQHKAWEGEGNAANCY